MKRPLQPSERRDWLRLSRTENVGPVTFRQLLHRYGNAKAALEAIPHIAQRGKRTLKIPPVSLIEDEIARCEKGGVRITAWCEPDYPDTLAAIEDAPPLFMTRGQMSLLHKRAIGLVGARNASLNGRKMTEILARDLGKEGLVITSGLARGIDTAAHQASLGTGTVAALAGGVDIVYPEENKALYDKMADVGCLLSDQPLGTEPMARLFPRRNRLISGLSLGIIVVEAALQSGSLITARMALEQGREVFAVPGSPLDPRCVGTNDLIRQGAVLTEKAADILEHIHRLPTRRLAEPPRSSFTESPLNVTEEDIADAQNVILENLSPTPVAIDELVRYCDLPAPIVLTVLLELELQGRVERQAGNKVAFVG